MDIASVSSIMLAFYEREKAIFLPSVRHRPPHLSLILTKKALNRTNTVTTALTTQCLAFLSRILFSKLHAQQTSDVNMASSSGSPPLKQTPSTPKPPEQATASSKESEPHAESSELKVMSPMR
ncbi:hypothetical protein [Kistimonas asteriae]|uniref:hypothetical protein n=1 Tax=Kistimonas asteriae TaxID=517724 RepID=UPI001BAA3F60|nr:hypothetical protein [Kistimonas asteriae]